MKYPRFKWNNTNLKINFNTIIEDMRIATHTKSWGKGILCFALAWILLLGSIIPAIDPVAIAAEGEVSTVLGAGSITTDLAPEIEIEVDLTTSEADSAQAQALLARATPEQRAELEAFYAQLDEIDRETEIAAEEYNAARMRLEYIEGSIQVSEQDIAILEQAFSVQAERLSERAVEIYRSGRVEMLLYLIFEANTFQEFFEAVDLVNRRIEADSDLMSRIRQQRSLLETSVQQLSIDESDAASLEFEMRARMIEITARNEDRKQELRDQNVTLLLLFEAEQLQRMLAEQALAESIAEGGNQNIVTAPGSPVETAMALRGVPYVWGGSSRQGFDCSGLMRFIFAQHGIDLPHHSGSQVLHGRRVEGNLLPGDLVFFGTPIHHVGMYVGGGNFIHSPRTGEVVGLRALASRSDLVAARRLDWQPREGAPR